MSKVNRIYEAKLAALEAGIDAEERRAMEMGTKYHHPRLDALRREAQRVRNLLMLDEAE